MSHAIQPEKTNIPSSAALWAVLIFVGLLIGAINFVQSMGHDDGAHGATTEHHDAGHAAPAHPAEQPVEEGHH